MNVIKMNKQGNHKAIITSSRDIGLEVVVMTLMINGIAAERNVSIGQEKKKSLSL